MRGYEPVDPADGAWRKYAEANGPFDNPLAVRADFWAGFHSRDAEIDAVREARNSATQQAARHANECDALQARIEKAAGVYLDQGTFDAARAMYDILRAEGKDQ